MFPDLTDVQRVSRALNLSQPAESIWPDVVLLRSFIEQARGACRNHGRNEFGLVSELKATAENFIGKSVSDDALKVAMKLVGLEIKPSSKDKQPLVKLPPLSRFEEKREAWRQCQRDLEQRMEAEKSVRH